MNELKFSDWIYIILVKNNQKEFWFIFNQKFFRWRNHLQHRPTGVLNRFSGWAIVSFMVLVYFLPNVAIASSLQSKKAVAFARTINESPLWVGCWLRESPLESCRFFNNELASVVCAAAQRWPWHQVDTKAGALTFSTAHS